MATDVTAKQSCRALVLFALEREAGPFAREFARYGIPWVVPRTSVLVHPGERGREVYFPDAADIVISTAGVGPSAARQQVTRLLDKLPRPGLVISAGFAGALRDGLAVGDVVIPAEVVDEADGRWPCHGSGSGRLLTAARLVAEPAEKRRLHEVSGAEAVDMESAAVAAVCAARGVPFAAVRAVSDTADTALSPRLVKLLSGGRVSPVRAAAAIARQPSLFGEFRRLARDTKIAAQKLAEALVQVIQQQSPPIALGGL